MRKIIVILSPNVTVTANNFEIFAEAGRKVGYEVFSVKSLKEALHAGDKKDVYVASGTDELIRLNLTGRIKTLYWIQGIVPEESLMRNSSKLRFFILSRMERYALKHAGYLAFVSEPMREHYESKYGLKFDGKYYIFPCFNTTMDLSAFDAPGKYKNNIFVYAGGLAIWQCFEKTLEIYKKVEDWGLPNTKLIVLTKDQEKARSMIEARGIKNFETGFTTPENLPNILKDAKFGFVIREDSPINRVATPTKISTYLSCGLIPIFGKSVETFRRFSEDMKYTVAWDDTDDTYANIRGFMTKEIVAEDVREEYINFFENNYSREKHLNALGDIIKTMIEE